MSENNYSLLRQTFIDVMSSYGDIYKKVWSENDWSNPFGKTITNDLPELIKQCTNINQPYIVDGSYGKGRWTSVPWIAIFDTRITQSAQKGVYIVYLFNKDTKELYLTLNQGATSVIQTENARLDGYKTFAVAGTTSSKNLNVLKNNAQKIRSMINDKEFEYGEEIHTGNKNYDAGAIYYKKYTLESLPTGEELTEDLLKMMAIYSQYQTLMNETDEWWPSKEEYDPGFTKEDWLKLLNNPEIIGPIWGGALAMFYAEGGAATCSELASIYNKDGSGIAGNCTQLAMKISKVTQCPLMVENEKNRYWPILFVGKKQEKGGLGNWIWKLRPELREAIGETDIMKYLPSKRKKAWLLTWNTNNYDWTDYYEILETVRSGETYPFDWACVSKKVEIGDRIYMLIVGAGDKNGIVVSGIATSKGYETEHWDPAKAAEGKKSNKIDFDIDWMLDYKSGEILKQSKLKEMFPNQEWSPQATGISIKDEYVDALEEEWSKFKDTNNNEPSVVPMKRIMTMKEKEAISQIKSYIVSQGFSYADGLIKNFYLSLKSKPFVILAGTSGTGKTRLVKLFAEAISAEYLMVPVRPDWSDSTDLFGHLDLNGKFIRGEIISFISKAQKNPDIPYILCLDEMNLARVEYYLSDFLSVIETRDLKDGEIISAPLVSEEKYGSDEEAREAFGEIRFPQNLYLVGTVNMDETTFPFSKKVLDRANTIEFNYVDLLPEEGDQPEEAEPLQLPNSFLKTKYLLLKQCKDDVKFVREISTELQTINQELQKANAHVGYRVRDEIVFYMLNNKETGLLERDEAFDNEIMQKVLPRIQGSSSMVKEMLCSLFKLFAGDYQGYSTSNYNVAENMLDKLRKDKAKYPKSAEKIAFMVRRFEEDGFTSYWL